MGRAALVRERPVWPCIEGTCQYNKDFKETDFVRRIEWNIQTIYRHHHNMYVYHIIILIIIKHHINQNYARIFIIESLIIFEDS